MKTAEVEVGVQRGRWVYIPDTEEIPMTFQLGMVGEDGVLLASDRAHVCLGQQPRSFFSGDKLRVNEDGNIAYCCAGDDFTQAVADDICRTSIPIELRGPQLKSFFERQTTNSFHKATTLWKSGGSILLARDAGNRVDLTRIVIYSNNACPMVYAVDDRTFQGDSVNPAIFFIERYLPSARYLKMPLEKLKVVAGHTVLMASELNQDGVHGLDIAICRHGKRFELVESSEIEALAATSKECDSRLAHSIGLRV